MSALVVTMRSAQRRMISCRGFGPIRSTSTLRVYVASTAELIGTLRNLGDGNCSGQFGWPTNAQAITVRSSSCGSTTLGQDEMSAASTSPLSCPSRGSLRPARARIEEERELPATGAVAGNQPTSVELASALVVFTEELRRRPSACSPAMGEGRLGRPLPS